MSELKTLQEQFQSAILEGTGETIIPSLKKSEKEGRETLFDVYNLGYRGRLLEFMENDYPNLWAYMGDEAFRQAVASYIENHPSDQPNARWYSQDFPAQLKTTELAETHPECVELAEFEKALNDAFDVPDCKILTMETMKLINPDQWGEFKFIIHPSAKRFDFNTNILEIWRLLEKKEEPLTLPDVIHHRHVEHVLVWRSAMTSRFRVLEADEAMIFDQAVKGNKFSELCLMLGTYWPSENAALKAAQYLHSWLASELISELA